MTYEPTDEEVRAFRCRYSVLPLAAWDSDVLVEIMKAFWAASPGPRRTEALRELAYQAHDLVRCGGPRGGCLVCGRMVECDCKLGPAIDRADAALAGEPAEPDPRDAVLVEALEHAIKWILSVGKSLPGGALVVEQLRGALREVKP